MQKMDGGPIILYIKINLKMGQRSKYRAKAIKLKEENKCKFL